MLLTKYYLLVCLPKSVSLFELNLKAKQGDVALAELLALQQGLTLSMDEYLAQGITIELGRYKKNVFTSPFNQFYLVVPDAWLRSIESRLPLVDSCQVRSLAALALASEVSHLTPELVCYRYSVSGQQDDWLLRVTTVPKVVYDVIGALLPKSSRFKGLISHQDCLDELCTSTTSKLTEDTLLTLSMKPSFEQKNHSSQDGRRWILLLCLAFISQLILLFSYEAEIQTLAKAQLNLEQAKLSAAPLAKLKINQAGLVARQIMQVLPLDVRVNSISSENGMAWLGISIKSETLVEMLPNWQAQWNKFQLSLMDEWQQPMKIESLNSQYLSDRTRSVLHVVIQIQKQ